MRRFHFTLDVLLQLRRRKEDEVKRRLAAKNGEIAAATRELRVLHDTMSGLQGDQQSRQGNNLDIVKLRYAVAYRFTLKADILRKSREIDALRAAAEGIRKELVRARQKTRTVELLRERKVAEWKKENASEELKRNDEISQQRYIRLVQAAAS